MYAVVVEFEIAHRAVPAFMEAMVRQADNSRRFESGCTRFDVCTDPADSTRIFLYELYADEAAFRDHLASAHFRSFDEAVREWVVSKNVRILTLAHSG